MGSVLNIINVNKTFDGTVAHDDFSLSVPRNSIIGIIGPNSAGKTTLYGGLGSDHANRLNCEDAEWGQTLIYDKERGEKLANPGDSFREIAV